MRNLSLILVVVVATASLSAQDKDISSATSTRDSLAAPTQWSPDAHRSEGCPVRFGAAVSSRATRHTAADLPADGSAVSLQLSFTGTGAPKISKASVRVHGWAPSRRFVPVGSAPSEDRTQIFQLVDTSGTSGLVNRDVRVNRMLVRWAEIVEMRYTDGSVWRTSQESYCRATPSLFHLVVATAR